MLSERMRNGHDPFGEAVAPFALRTEGLLAPHHVRAQLAFRVIVRRLDARRVDERPHRRAVREDVRARAAHAGRAEADAGFEVPLEDGTQVADHLAELLDRECSVADLMPPVEQQLRQRGHARAQIAGFARALREARELSNQVSPADLPFLHRPEPELRAPVGHEDPGDGVEERPELPARAVDGHREERGRLGRDRPRRPRRATLPPAGRVDVLDRLLAHVIAHVLDGHGDRVAHALLGFAERAERDLDVEDIAEPADGTSPAHMVDAGHLPDEGEQARAEHPRARAGGQCAARHLAAVAHDAVLAELDHVRRDHGNLDHLMAQRRGIGPPRHSRATATAVAGEALLGSRQLLGRQQLALPTLVPRLATALATGGLFLRARAPVVWGIGRRREVGVRRVLAELRFQRVDPREQLHDKRFELRNPPVAFVGHTYCRSHRDPRVDPKLRSDRDDPASRRRNHSPTRERLQ